VIGAGAAGLMTAIQAGRAARASGKAPRIVALDGAKTLGAKILVAGGGRCNVTHHAVDERAFCGSTPPAIRNVLRRFDVDATVRFFEDLGVRLKREETGKLFPTTDRARTVLDALVSAARGAGVELRHPWRVTSVAREDEVFVVRGPAGTLRANRIALATGGCSLPKSGSDGWGYEIARSLGHTTTARIVPALVPLLLADGSFLRGLSGISSPATLTVRTASGKALAVATGPTLCTHFGLSGPAVLDISRHWLLARADGAGARLVIDWLPGLDGPGLMPLLGGVAPPSVRGGLRSALPDRLADALCREADVEPDAVFARLPRAARARLTAIVRECELSVVGDRGFTHAEATAGGVPLAEVSLKTLESRRTAGAFIVGEILDVDGRIGGFNFQWAWATGAVAGRAIGEA